MSLIDRLSGVERPKLAVHVFYAALAEFAAGQVTKAQIVSYFDLDNAEESQLDFIIAAYQSADSSRKQEFLEFIHRIFILAESEVPGYDNANLLSIRISDF